MANGQAVTMHERVEPVFQNFSAGDTLEGVLLKLERINVRDKETGAVSPAVRYTVTDDDGVDRAFLGTHQLNVKLRPSDCGHRVEIRCIGENTSVKRGNSCMKEFEVRVSKEVVDRLAVLSDPLEITDADIPF